MDEEISEKHQKFVKNNDNEVESMPTAALIQRKDIIEHIVVKGEPVDITKQIENDYEQYIKEEASCVKKELVESETNIEIEVDPKDILCNLNQEDRNQKDIDSMNIYYYCNDCNKQCVSKAELLRHLIHHDPKSKYACKQCNLRFRQSKSLKNHVLKTHEKIKSTQIHTCNLCNKLFSTSVGLKGHMKMHNGKPYACQYCKKTFSLRGGMVRHMKIHTGEKPNVCSVCGKCLSDTTKMRNHIRIHTGEKPYACNICDKSYHAQNNLRTHMAKHSADEINQENIIEPEHIVVKVEPPEKTEQIENDCEQNVNQNVKIETVYVKEEPIQSETYIEINVDPKDIIQEDSNQINIEPMNIYYYCNDCNKQCVTKTELLRHLIYHDPRSKHACEICNIRFRKKESLKNHVAKAHENVKSTQILPCNLCNKTFNSSEGLEGHMRMHRGERPYSCQYCKKAFTFKRSMIRHMKIHTGEKPNVCPICGKSFLDITKMRHHLRIHTGEKPYACNICDKSYHAQNNLRSHMARHASGKIKQKTEISEEKKVKIEKSINKPKVTIFNCESCDKTFQSKSKLAVHNRKHTGEKPYTCNICDRKFSLQHSMKAHIRTHTGEKPYSCIQCDKKFTQAGSLQSHITYVHSKEKPFTCNVCKKGFSYNTKLVLHMRQHTGEKPYACDKCDKSFAILASLKKHFIKCPFNKILPAKEGSQ